MKSMKLFFLGPGGGQGTHIRIPWVNHTKLTEKRLSNENVPKKIHQMDKQQQSANGWLGD